MSIWTPALGEDVTVVRGPCKGLTGITLRSFWSPKQGKNLVEVRDGAGEKVIVPLAALARPGEPTPDADDAPARVVAAAQVVDLTAAATPTRPKGYTHRAKDPRFVARVHTLHHDGASQRDIAAELGVGQTTVSRVLRRTVAPTPPAPARAPAPAPVAPPAVVEQHAPEVVIPPDALDNMPGHVCIEPGCGRAFHTLPALSGHRKAHRRLQAPPAPQAPAFAPGGVIESAPDPEPPAPVAAVTPVKLRDPAHVINLPAPPAPDTNTEEPAVTKSNVVDLRTPMCAELWGEHLCEQPAGHGGAHTATVRPDPDPEATAGLLAGADVGEARGALEDFVTLLAAVGLDRSPVLGDVVDRLEAGTSAARQALRGALAGVA